MQRAKFAIDITQGMSWLHNTKPHQIIHRDCASHFLFSHPSHIPVKLSNVLVDANLRAKVADFGLSDFLKADFLQVLCLLRIYLLGWFTLRTKELQSVAHFG